jgi:CPA2 family monovalent cation:H+ antiporter-2
LRLPAIVGYLLAGVAIGPFTPGFVGDQETISQLAELGVIFLMLGVGIHFNLRDLWQVRHVAIPGAVAQMTITTIIGFMVTRFWGWSVSAGIVLGLAISIASTVVLLRALMDRGLLQTRHGQIAIGWLVLEDIATVLILVLLPALAPSQGNVPLFETFALTIFKAVAFLGIMLVVGTKVIPWLLMRIAFTRSRELFILAILTIAIGAALGAAELFGVSLALGAFIAGVIISESPFSHQVAADLVPFREAFAVLFFVSIGMLVNPQFIIQNAGMILMLTFIIVVGKTIVTLLMGFMLPASGRTMLVVAAGLSQIGEFSFILGQSGLKLGILEADQYSLILAGAIVSITLNPFMFRLIKPAEAFLQRRKSLWKWFDRHGEASALVSSNMNEHVVVIGYGRVGKHIVDVLATIGVPCLVVDMDAERIDDLKRRGTPTLFGDAANSEVLTHAELTHSRATVITLPDEAATAMVVAAVRQINTTVPIIARATSHAGVKQLAGMGADDVIHPELEGGLEVVRFTLLRLNYPAREVQKYADTVRRNYYIELNDAAAEREVLDHLGDEVTGVELTWIEVPANSPLIGQTLAEADIRGRTGASVVAIMRDQRVMPNPKSLTVFRAGDVLGLITDDAQNVAVHALLHGENRINPVNNTA